MWKRNVRIIDRLKEADYEKINFSAGFCGINNKSGGDA
jgi:hypothetical protein